MRFTHPSLWVYLAFLGVVACADDGATNAPSPLAPLAGAAPASSETLPPTALPPTAAMPAGGSTPTSTGLTGSTSPVGAGGAAAPGVDFAELLAADWELAPGTEQYVCVRKSVDTTVFIGAWRGMSPLGTHHVALTTSAEPDGEPDGVSACDVSTLGTQNIYGSGVGTREKLLPPGVAMKLEQGSQLLLNLHLFNATDKPLRGRSGAMMKPIDESDVRVVADGVVAGPTKLTVPPGRSTSRGMCTFDREATIFGIMPHMHQTGVSMQVIAHTTSKGDVVLFDGPYNFDDQVTYPIDMLQFKAGDTVEVACTYENTTGNTLHWGGSSNDEMCNAGLGRIPAGGPSICNQ
ncbi:MAG TPA: hypothetical protein VFG30_25855 [Polyangiales bacterium]|nr:hypothetical protein [Polyangiales bacterium]